MHQSERKDDASSNDQGIKKALRWPDYFAWMVKIAEGLVGKNDAQDVANAALYDYCCSGRPRPSMDQRQDVERLLRHLVWERARDFWKRRKQHKSEVLFRFDPDEQHPEFDQTVHNDDVVDRLILMRALESLSEDERDLVLGYYLEECTAKELAHERKTNQNTVNARIRRSLPRMAAAVAEQHRRARKNNGRETRGVLFLPWLDDLRKAVLLRLRDIRETWAHFKWRHLGERVAFCLPLAAFPGPTALSENVLLQEEQAPREEFQLPMEHWALHVDTLVAYQDLVNAETRSTKIGSVMEVTETGPTNELSDLAEGEALSSEANAPNLTADKPFTMGKCETTLVLATAKKNSKRFEECLTILQTLHQEDPVCAQTDDWRLLNNVCRHP